MLSIRIAAPFALLLLSGCVSGPDHTPPETPVPVKFTEGGAKSAGDVSANAWWGAFNDKKLNSIIDQGLVQNLTVLQALERITAAQANVIQAGAGALPSLDLSASETVSGQAGERDLRQQRGVTYTTGSGASVSWLLDLWGQYRRSKESAKASLDAAYASADVARLSLLSEVATAYVDARYFQQRLAVANKNLKSRQETLSLTKFQLEAGAASRLDVVQAEGLVNSTLSDMPGLETGFITSTNRIATLLGLPAGTLRAELTTGRGQPVARMQTKAGVPADLIRNRPDIRAAERTLAASVANIGVAESQLYPTIFLSGSITPNLTNSSGANGFLTPWSFGPSLTLPIFDGGRLRAGVDIAKSNARLDYLNWKETVLNAVEEVENSLSSLSRDARTVSALRASVKSYEEALELSTASYRDGASSLLDVLDAQRQVATAQASLAAAVQQMANDYVALNVAIGGGYAPGAKAGH